MTITKQIEKMKAIININEIPTTVEYIQKWGSFMWLGQLGGEQFEINWPYDRLKFSGKTTLLSEIEQEAAKIAIFRAFMDAYENNPVRLCFTGAYGTPSGVFGGENFELQVSADGNALCGLLKNGLDWNAAQRQLKAWATKSNRTGISIAPSADYAVGYITFSTWAAFAAALDEITPAQIQPNNDGFEIEYHGDHEMWNGIRMD